MVYRGEEIFTTIRPDIITPNITMIDVEVESTTTGQLGRQWTARTDPRTAAVSTRVPIGREDRLSEPSGRSNFGNFRGQSFETMKEIPRTSTMSSTSSTSNYRTSYRPSTTTRLTPTSTRKQEDFDQGKSTILSSRSIRAYNIVHFNDRTQQFGDRTLTYVLILMMIIRHSTLYKTTILGTDPWVKSTLETLTAELPNSSPPKKFDKNFGKLDRNSDNSDHFQDLLRIMDQRQSRQSIEDKLRELENMGSSDYSQSSGINNGDRGYNERDFNDRGYDRGYNRGYDRDNEDGFGVLDTDLRVSLDLNIQNKVQISGAGTLKK